MHDIRPKSQQFLLHTPEVPRKRHVEPQVLLHSKGEGPTL
jgi:hypothetical protein